MDKKDAENLSGNTKVGIEGKSIRKDTTPVAETERWKETDRPVDRTSNGNTTHVQSSGHGELGGSVLVGALKGIKGKNITVSEEQSPSFTDDVFEDGVDLEMMSYSGGLSTAGDTTTKDNLTDVGDTVTSFWELERRERREMSGASGANEDQNVPPNDMDASKVELRASSRSNRKATQKRVDRLFPKALRNSLVVILSGIYGIILVVMGLVLPLSETFADPEHPYFFEIFYIYLYTLSMAFLVYVYTYLLGKERSFLQNLPKTISRTLSKTISRSSVRSRSSAKSDKNGPSSDKPLVRENSLSSGNSGKKRRKFAYNSEVSHHTGSFYLRVGVIGFGIGSMIHSGLTFAHYLEISRLTNHCSDVIKAIKPLAHLTFTFVQMYFIFMNSKMCVHKYKTLARFGLMHMSCTNICVWLKSVVVETLQLIKVDQREAYNAMVRSYHEYTATPGRNSNEVGSVQTLEEYLKEHKIAYIPEISCGSETIMGKIVESSSVYLYTCTIEYCFVCACVLYVMWSNVGEGYTPKRPDSCSDYDTLDSDEDSDDDNAHHRMSVDCAASSRGLFLGILLFVAAVVCIVCFYVLTSNSSHVSLGTLLGHICEEIILVVAFLATAIAAYQMRDMRFSGKRKVGIEEILTLVSISGLGLYGIWSITAAVFHLDTLHGRLTLITNLFMLVQSGSQTTFTIASLRASVRNHQQLREKPGRQCVTFLLICNFALWVVNTFETQRIEYNQIQVNFYGTTAWAIFSHISVPLGIYFRFNATVNLSIIWKKAWKKKDHHESTTSHEQQPT